MLKPSDPVIVRQPINHSRTNELLTGHVVSATSTHVKVAVEGEENPRTFAARQVEKSNAGELNNFMRESDEIVTQSFTRRQNNAG